MLTRRLCQSGRRFYYADHGIYGVKTAQPPKVQRPNALTDVDSALIRLVHAYRTYGHRTAQLDPLGMRNRTEAVPELDLKLYGLENKLTSNFKTEGLLNINSNMKTLNDILAQLKQIYCTNMAAEFMHLETLEEREWFASKFESISFQNLPNADRKQYAKIMLECQNFDHYLALKFATTKRYGGEGAESMMPFFWEIFAQSPKYDLKEVIVCMPHRGRLNLLTTLLRFPAVLMFQKMKGKLEFPPGVKGLGDVLSHLSASVDLKMDGSNVHVTMVPNPSHLEANNPVAVGKARARMQSLKLGEYSDSDHARDGDGVLCLQIHGDASCVGQGVVPETLTMTTVPNFRIGGSVHLVVNNQIGFTTDCEIGRSYEYCTDVAKMVSCPIIHVNGDYPELMAKATRLALEYRDIFRKDIFLDLICFRRWGHNELDDPSFTQPLMYDVINKKQSVPDVYAGLLEKEGVIQKSDHDQWLADHNKLMTDQLKQIDSYVPKAKHLEKQWSGYIQAPSSVEIWDTGVDIELLKSIGAKSIEAPSDFEIHAHLKKTHCDARLKKINDGRTLDWATAEALAFGSLLHEGCPVRISGQDVGRGTFSHRHVMLVDRKTDKIHIPLNHIMNDQKAFLEVANSILSEEAVLGFEYGMAIENPKRLVVWEAQFGDFFNGAQIIIDTYLTCGETKWLLQNGLVMLLPHGYDGAGPEHSSCRIERFLQLTDSKENGIDGEDVNCNIVHPTTSAQYFHLLRRQVVRDYRKPLVVASPKILLRLPAASSSLSDLSPGTHFHPVLDDVIEDINEITKVIFCSGKHFYALARHRETNKLTNVAIVRLEALCPFPAQNLQEIVSKYNKAQSYVWSQEEPRNMGPWSFVNTRFQNLIGRKLSYAGRPELPIVANAVGEVHQREHEQVISDTFSLF